MVNGNSRADKLTDPLVGKREEEGTLQLDREVKEEVISHGIMKPKCRLAGKDTVKLNGLGM